MHVYKRIGEQNIMYVMQVKGNQKILILCGALELILNVIVLQPEKDCCNSLDEEEEAPNTSSFIEEVTELELEKNFVELLENEGVQKSMKFWLE